MADAPLYMPEGMMGLADVHIKLRDGTLLPTHKHLLATSVGALPGDVPGMLEATPSAPLVLSRPFDDFEKADVVDFFNSASGTSISFSSEPKIFLK
jgi:hypothetical protein